MAPVIRLLYVDDEPSLLDIGKLFLEESGNFSVTTIESATAALSLLKTEPFDVIVSDYQMPGMDGIRFLIEVRKEFGHIPFILFTGRGREEIVIQAINSGADFYLQKGGDPGSQFAELSHKIKAAVSQRANELAFKESEERFRAISEYSHTAICIIDEQAKIVWANDMMQELGGYSPEQLYRTESFVGFLAPESIEFVVSNFQKVLTGEPYEHHYSFYFIRADGKKRLCEKHMMDVVNSHGKRNLIISMLDVTDRRQAEDALRASEERHHLINDASLDSIYSYDRSGRFTSANRSLCKVLQLRVDQIIGRTHAELGFPKDTCREWDELHRQVYESGATITAPTSSPMPDGKIHQFEVVLNPLHDSTGIIIGIAGTTRDITDLKLSEEKLRQQTDAMEAAVDGMALLNADQNYSYMNKAHAAIYGYDNASELIGRSWRDLYDPDELQRFEQEIMPELGRIGYYRGRATGMKKDKSTFPQEISLTTLKDGGLICVVRDITERKQAEERLNESEERYLSLFDRSLDCIYVHDLEGNFIDANPAALALLGYTHDDISKLSFISLISRDQLNKAVESIRTIVETGTQTNLVQYRLQTKNGEFVEVETKASLILHNKKPYAVLGIARDITDRKRAEAALQHQSVTLSILNDIITTANKADSLPQLLTSILSESLRLLDFDAGGIYLVDRSTRTANIVHSQNLPTEFLAEIQTTSIDKKPYDALFIQKESFITDNYAKINPALSKKYGFQSIASIPLLSKGAVIGALNVTSKRRQVISEEEKQTLFSIGRELGSTIERMAAEEEGKKAAKNLETLFNSIEEMVFVLDMQGHILVVNDAVLKYLLYTPEELAGMDVLQLHVPERREEALRNVQGMIAGTIDSCPVPVLAKDGTRIEAETKVTHGWWNGSEVLIGVTRDITERKVAEMELKESEQKFRSLVEYSLEGILILDFSGNILFANNAAAHMIEVNDGFLLSGRNVMEFIAPASREDVIKDFIQVAQGHDAYIAHYHAISAKGKKIFVESIGKIFTYEGKPADLLSIRDITEQKKAKDALVESSRKYTELFELGSVAIFLIDNETGAILEANAAASEMYGYLREVLLTMKNTDLSAEMEDSQKFTTKTTEGTIRVTLRHHRRSDGTVFPVEILGRIFTWNERPVHIAAIRDITESKRAEEALKESHDRFEQISAQSREIIWEVDPDGLFTYVSHASYAIIGFTPEELIKKKYFYDLFPIEQREAMKASTLNAFSEQQAFHDIVNILQTKDGQNVWMSMNGMPIFDEYNNFLGYRGSGSDITGRKQAEEIRTRFGRILESSLNEIYFFDAQTLMFVDVNHGARENIGYTMDELRTMTPLDITTEYTKESFETLLSTLRTGEKEIEVVFTVHKRKDGSLYPVEVHLQFAGNEVSPVFVAIILDITERRQTEEALRLANWKLNLLSGITRHDINNQMTVLRGYISLLEMKQNDPALNEYIQKMDTSAQRISSMIQFTKEYEDLGITEPAWQEIRTLVTNAAKEISFGKILLNNDLPAGMEIFSEPLIFKVFYNLMDNAVRYGETIKNIRFFVENRNGDRIIVCEDDGVGVPESEKEKIFLRGFGKNTGLGLALTQEILEITGISIEETGEPGKGARFEIVVPKGMWRFKENNT